MTLDRRDFLKGTAALALAPTLLARLPAAPSKLPSPIEAAVPSASLLPSARITEFNFLAAPVNKYPVRVAIMDADRLVHAFYVAPGTALNFYYPPGMSEPATHVVADGTGTFGVRWEEGPYQEGRTEVTHV